MARRGDRNTEDLIVEFTEAPVDDATYEAIRWALSNAMEEVFAE